MPYKAFFLPALAILCIMVIAIVVSKVAFNASIIYISILSIAGLGGYSVRTAGQTNNLTPATKASH